MGITADRLKEHLEQVVDPSVFAQLSPKAFKELENMANTLNQPQQPERAPARGR
jgi:hypothetical protein